METVKGYVEEIVFRNVDNGYCVLYVSADNTFMTAVGNFPPIEEGEYLELKGEFVLNNKFGEQFNVSECKIISPDTLESICKYLASGLFYGVGEVTAKNIVDAFGVQALDVIEKFPNKIAQVKGLSLKKALAIHESYIVHKEQQATIVYLQSFDISLNLALKIYKKYGDGTKRIIEKNPYQMVEDVDGVGFITADKIALNMGFDKFSRFRISAAIGHVLQEAANKNGHTYLLRDDVTREVCRLLKLDFEEYSFTVESVILDNVVMGKIIIVNNDGVERVMLTKTYENENGIARCVANMLLDAAPIELNFDVDIRDFQKSHDISLHEGQIEAVKNCVKYGINVITGGPGTGKTTIINCILYILKKQNSKVALCAPTGRAAKRLSEATGEDAKTIHRLLDLDFTGGKGHFNFNEDTKLKADVVIVDEVSMCDEYVFYALVRAMKRGARLILVGDKDQLPSVGAGNILADIISCDLIPINYLTHIYRQSDDSLIIENAHKVNKGQMPTIDNRSKDFFFDSQSDTQLMLKNCIELTTKRLPSFAKITPKDIQVLCPMKKGVLGVENVNIELQKALNPPSHDKGEIRSGNNIFRVGDKIIHTVNNYQMEWTSSYGISGTGVFNGDIGYIIEINKSQPSMKVEFDDGKIATYKHENFDELTLAYAISIHKSQGSEFPAVIITVSGGNPFLMTRNLLYTAITRAKSFVVIEGSKESVAKMVKNDYTAKRNTLLSEFIVENCKKVGISK
ncbi:MAG: ATP-dependent RecD-like DNA helicase [Clostridia bacterium]|nr:ATP-dependent RecD-like DNA helicase [Clostridia bacterium]